MLYCICILYYWLIGNNWFPLTATGCIISAVTALMTLPLPESPRLLLAQGRLEEAKACFDLIARWNGKKIDW